MRAVAIVLTLGCSYPEFAFGVAPDAATDSTAIDTAMDAPCALPVGGAKLACTSIAKLTSPSLCGVTATYLDTKNAAAVDPAPPPMATDHAEIHAAWSPDALHVRARVFDAKIAVVPEGGLDIYNGDSLEVFVTPAAPKTGNYSDDHALQIDVAPPSGTIPGRAVIYLGGSTKGPADPAIYSVRLIDGGYEVEVRIPWMLVGGAIPTAGSTIGIDFAVNDDDDAAKKGDQIWYVMEKKAVMPPTSCGTNIQPSCDTRTFCTTTLSP